MNGGGANVILLVVGIAIAASGVAIEIAARRRLYRLWHAAEPRQWYDARRRRNRGLWLMRWRCSPPDWIVRNPRATRMFRLADNSPLIVIAGMVVIFVAATRAGWLG